MSKFFIHRPVFAWVLAIIMMIAGGLAIMQLPIAQYPTIAPPAVAISATYPGADAQTVQDTVTQVIEQNMNGIDNLMYMSSTSDSAGGVTITLTFKSGTDPDIAQVQVQNKLQLATPLLPQEVQQQGISVEKSSSSFLLVAGFISDNPSTTQDDISDYVASNVKDTISRLNGVGDVQLFGAQYAMRVWLDGNLLNKYNLTPVDVINQLQVQNDQIAAGQLGGTPAIKGQQRASEKGLCSGRCQIPYVDCIVVKVRQNGSVINKAVFLALGINTEGRKELLGMWLAENEGAKFWLSVLTEMKNRGLQDILIACVDGLKGFPDAINSVFPQTHIQLCIIHMVRNSLKYVSWKDYKAVTSGLKAVYQAPTEEAALMALDAFAGEWDDKYPQISKSWRAHWENLNTFFSYPPDIRKAIYTTNAIESLNSVIRAAIKKRKVFPTDDSVRKVIYLAIKDASKKWSMPIQNWRLAMSRFIIEFGDRLSDHL